MSGPGDEARALRRAALCLVALSVVRVAHDHRAARVTGSASSIGSSVLDSLERRTARASDEADRRTRPLGSGERIDPNVADEIELDRLPGVGPATATAIVVAREAGAVFRQPDDLTVVSGIGPATAARLSEALSFEGARGRRSARAGRAAGSTRASPAGRGDGAATGGAEPVDLNRASPEALESLPGIGPALSERIVRARSERPFTNLDDLTRVPGIGPASVERLRGLAYARARR